MSMYEIKTVINDIIDDYNLDIIALVAIVIFGLYTFLLAPIMFVSTTDAVIDGHILNVTSRASGQISQCYIMKDQEVRKGDLLMEINPKDYENELLKLNTNLEINKEKLKMLTTYPTEPAKNISDLEKKNKYFFNSEQSKSTGVSKPPQYIKGSNKITNYSKTYEPENLAETNLARKKAALGDAVQNMTDMTNAQQQKDIKQEENEKTEQDSEEKVPDIDKTKIDISNDTVDSVKKEIKNLESQKEEIKLLLSSTRIYAPQDGIISGVSISQGDVVNSSDVLCTLTPKQVWVIARVNPSQLEKIRIGQPVKIKIPTYKNRTFKGTITSVDTTAKVYQVKAHEHITQVDTTGQPLSERPPAYQIKIEFIEDYSDFNLPPDTQVSARIQVQSFTK